MSIKKYAPAILVLVLAIAIDSVAQNVGVGTSTPQRKFVVNGSIMLDQTNKNTGELDSAALVFGSTGNVGISSRKIGVAGTTNDLQFWTNGQVRLDISPVGQVGIGGPHSDSYILRVHNGNSLFDGNIYSDGSIRALSNAAVGGALDPSYKLRVYDGNTRLGGDLYASGNVAIGGDVDPAYRLRVWAGDVRFGGDMHATGNVAFGGSVDPLFRMRVYGGNSRFGGDVEITGTANTATLNTTDMNVTNNFTIKNTGSVRSEGSSPLRIGFEQLNFNNWTQFDPYEKKSYALNLSDFANASDVRVTFAGYDPANDASSAFSQRFRFQVISINAVSNTVTVQIFNDSDASSELLGTVYFLAVIKDN